MSLVAVKPVSIYWGQPTLAPQLIYTVPSTAECLIIKEILYTQVSSAGFGTLTFYRHDSGSTPPDNSKIFLVKDYTAAPSETRYAELSTVLNPGEFIWVSSDAGGESVLTNFPTLCVSGVVYDVVS